MSWNKPSSVPQPPPTKSAPPSLKRGLLAGLVVVVLGVLGLYLFSSGEATSPSLQKKERGRIKEVTPAPAPKRTREAPSEPKPLPPQHAGEVRNGMRMLSSGKLLPVTSTIITTSFENASIEYRTFKHWTDRRLAAVLTAEPGETFVGDSSQYYRDFAKDFRKSLEEPIEYDRDDSQYVKELKIGVQQLRQELKERMENGEDIEKLMADTREQWRELGLYRRELNEQVVELTQDEELSQADYDDIIAAANRMLEERGAKPLELPTVVKHRIRLATVKEKDAN